MYFFAEIFSQKVVITSYLFALASKANARDKLLLGRARKVIKELLSKDTNGSENF